MKLKENKYDPISEKFRNLLNEVYETELSIQEATIFIRNYFYLLDSYISYNERELNKKYINESKSKYENRNENLTKYKYIYKEKEIKIREPSFDEIIDEIGKEKEEFYKKIKDIRNAITHDFWMYLTDKEINKEPEIKEYIENILERTTPKEIFNILKNINFYSEEKKEKKQGEKWAKEIFEKIYFPLKQEGINPGIWNFVWK